MVVGCLNEHSIKTREVQLNMMSPVIVCFMKRATFFKKLKTIFLFPDVKGLNEDAWKISKQPPPI